MIMLLTKFTTNQKTEMTVLQGNLFLLSLLWAQTDICVSTQENIIKLIQLAFLCLNAY